MRVVLALAVLAAPVLAGCSGVSGPDPFPGPYRVSVTIDSSATRGDFDVTATAKQGGTILKTAHFDGPASGDRVLFNETMPAGDIVVSFETAYSYESDSGGSQTSTFRQSDFGVAVSGSRSA